MCCPLPFNNVASLLILLCRSTPPFEYMLLQAFFHVACASHIPYFLYFLAYMPFPSTRGLLRLRFLYIQSLNYPFIHLLWPTCINSTNLTCWVASGHGVGLLSHPDTLSSHQIAILYYLIVPSILCPTDPYSSFLAAIFQIRYLGWLLTFHFKKHYNFLW